MTSSPERIAANKANAQKSTGPVTAEGKEASRANSLKHGLSGEGIVMAEDEGAEIAERAQRMRQEMKPVTEVGRFQIERMAIYSVRVERCAIDERVRLAMMNDGEGGFIDFSEEGRLAYRYEQAANRNYDKALANFRKVEAEAKENKVVATAPEPTTSDPLASFGYPGLDDVDEIGDDEDMSLVAAHLAKFLPDYQPISPNLKAAILKVSAAAGPDPVD